MSGDGLYYRKAVFTALSDCIQYRWGVGKMQGRSLYTDEVTACWKEMRYVNKMIKIWQNVMWVIDSILTSCYYDVSIIPYWTYEVLTVIRVAVRRGNQVRILSDPVTVTEERLFDIPLYDSMRRGKEVMILKSGNLLCMARLNFRVKCNNQLRVSATQSVVCWLEAGIFLWNSPVRMNYTSMLLLRWPPQSM